MIAASFAKRTPSSGKPARRSRSTSAATTAIPTRIRVGIAVVAAEVLLDLLAGFPDDGVRFANDAAIIHFETVFELVDGGHGAAIEFAPRIHKGRRQCAGGHCEGGSGGHRKGG